MKKLVCIILIFSLLMTSIAFADDLDYSYIKACNDVYTIDINDDGNAFITPAVGTDDLKIVHKYSLDDHPSFIYSDIIVLDYYGDPTPVWRIWINYVARHNLGISSVTINLPKFDINSNAITDGIRSYTFTGIGGKDQIESHDGYISETPCIVMGSNNMLFWAELIMIYESLSNFDQLLEFTIPITLHGTIEDVETEISGMVNADLWLAAEAAYHLNMNSLLEEEGTKMTAK